MGKHRRLSRVRRAGIVAVKGAATMGVAGAIAVAGHSPAVSPQAARAQEHPSPTAQQDRQAGPSAAPAARPNATGSGVDRDSDSAGSAVDHQRQNRARYVTQPYPVDASEPDSVTPERKPVHTQPVPETRPAKPRPTPQQPTKPTPRPEPARPGLGDIGGVVGDVLDGVLGRR